MLALESGSTLGRYTLLLPVGQGGQAAVWAASLTGLAGFEKTVAVKTLLPPRDAEEAHIERFTDEALLATRLHHQNVVEVLDFGEEDGVLYIVMPWIDGEPVNAIIDVASKKNGIPFAVAANLIGQACRGLHAAHELTSEQGEPLGLVHRDVSPENILVTREGTAKIGDFGVATARGHLGLLSGDNDLGRARGKIWYMAPEELWGEPVDRRADLFALGVVLYRMTTGRHPFGTVNGRESVRRLLAGTEPAVPRSFLPDYPAALEALLLRVLAEKPDERPATALEFRQELFRAVAPASDDDVAQFLAELFSGRRLERDERLRVALETRGPSPTNPPAAELDSERSNFRKATRLPVTRARKRAVGFGVVAAALGLLAGVSLVEREGVSEALPVLDARAIAARPEPVQASDAPRAILAEPPALARTEPPSVEQQQSREKARGEKPPVDVSPVREVGF
jgi:eukaryotic-like serine/threonine-protein kinase